MSFLPIVERELRLRARAKSTFNVRIIAACVSLALVAWLLLAMIGAQISPGKAGSNIFVALTWLSLVYCLLEGPRVTADCLSSEKRDGTLGLLFLTDLKGYDVVLGKLVACSLNSFYCLLSLLPPLAVPILIGGVAGAEFGRLAIALFNALFFSMSIGMIISAISQTERDALSGTGVTVVMLSVVPFLFPALPALSYLSPVSVFRMAVDSLYQVDPSRYWIVWTTTHGLGWACLVAASLILPRNWSERSGINRKTANRAPRGSRFAIRQSRVRRIDLACNPVIWLARSPRRFKFYLWTASSITAASGWVWLAANFAKPDYDTLLIAIIGSLGLNLIFATSVAMQACTLFPHARDSGELEIILTTPLKVTQIAHGYAGALWRQFRGPMTLLFATESIIVVLQYAFMFGASAPDRVLLTILLFFLTVAGMVGSVTDLVAAGWLGLWLGLRMRKPGAAVTKTVLLALILPLAAGGVACSLLWPVFWMIKNFVIITFAQRGLYGLLRYSVAEQFASPVAPSALKPNSTQLPSVLPKAP